MFKEMEMLSRSMERSQHNKTKIESNRKKIHDKVDFMELNPTDLVEKRIHRLGATPEIGFERLIGSNDNLLNINYLKRGVQVARTVCRLVWVDVFGRKSPQGTGFMVSPHLLMTNNHVIPDREAATSFKAEFGYESNMDGTRKIPTTFSLNPDAFFVTSPQDELDYTLVAVTPQSEEGTQLNTFGWNKLIGEVGKILTGEALTIIQHPAGEPKQIALRENFLLDRDERFLFYETDTKQGSSGSPVFNNQWEVVALHHFSVPATDDQGNILTKTGEIWHASMGDHKINWVTNEGVRISRILADVNMKPLLSEAEQSLRNEFLTTESSFPALVFSQEKTQNPLPNLPSPLVGRVSSPSVQRLPSSNGSTKPSPVKETRFELFLEGSRELMESALSEIYSRWGVSPGQMFKDNEAGNSTLARFYEVHILTAENLWDVARQIESIDGVGEVDPDLPSLTWADPNFAFPANGQESMNSVMTSNRVFIEADYCGIKPKWNHEVTEFDKGVAQYEKTNPRPGIPQVKVAQLDTGFSGHPEIGNLNFKAGYDFIDDDAYAGDHFGGGVYAQPGHGTRTAAVMAGIKTGLPEDKNEGVFPSVDFVPFRVSNSVVILGTSKNITRAVHHAINNEFDIIMMCMGGLGKNSWKKLARMAYDNGVFWVCAAGNQVRFVVRPAAYPGTIAVGGINYKKKTWKGSSRGRAVEICAPAENVFVPRSNFEGDEVYNYGSGTSYATPHVAGAIALWLSYHKEKIADLYEFPWQRVEAFRQCMAASATVPSDWDKRKYGAGILNVNKLLKTRLPSPGKLIHRYGGRFFEAIGDTKISLTDKELLYHYWNRSLPDETPQKFEKMEMPIQPFSNSTQNHYSKIKNTGGSSFESIGGDQIHTYLAAILDQSDY